ncbi:MULTISPECIES: hypothetical protein [unclassified Nocardioides]|uniref:hypothetical protein n=1 Tax=unclassified Nocardioides TaxID=2615069 RepID=UPI0012E3BECE|nr:MULTISPECIES: hypothetical protein [unclassified Nocardioides]
MLIWCTQSAISARPLAFSNLTKRPSNPFLLAAADEPLVSELVRALEHTRAASTTPLASLAELTTPHPNDLVEHWRHAARAAALAEHDTGPDLHGRLSTPESLALLGDVAAVTQALVVLDQRYRNTPGWQPLASSQRLGWSALACALDVGLGQPDYSVDQAGWQPRVKAIRGPVRPGILGVLQAEHNVLVRLKAFPNVLNLRRIVDSQHLLSPALARLAAPVAPEVADAWTDRGETYGLVQKQLRDLGGNLGAGAHAAAEAANAVSRLRHVPHDDVLEPRTISAFQMLFHRTDDRICDVIEEGVRRGAFVQRVTVPRLVDNTHQMVHPVRERFVVVADPRELAVVTTARERLRPTATSGSPSYSDRTRAELQAALVHRPPPRQRSVPDAAQL